MFKRILLGVMLISLGCLTPVAADPLPAGLEAVNAAQVMPNKADWNGQKAVFFPAKLYQNVSFLFLYQNPTVASSGVDQLALGRSLVGKAFFIKGLYQLKKDAATEYYWYLTTDTGSPAVWVKDSKDKLLSDQPFALEAEIAKEKRDIEQLMVRLPGHPLWNNRTVASSFGHNEWADHLAPLTIREFHSDGPFSENYQLLLTKEDGSTAEWKAGLGTTPPAYNHQQFYDLLQQVFYLKSPYEAHPNWSEANWTSIMARKVIVGMDQDMVSLSWGAAKQVTKAKDGTETWEYPDKRYLIIKDKMLTKIKVPKPQPVKDANKDTRNAKDTKDVKPKPNQSKDADIELVEVPEAGPIEKAPDTSATEKEKKR